ncbi:E3 ubiquitin/ISG15 ligase TRIM25-like [Symphorus nematophorus]
MAEQQQHEAETEDQDQFSCSVCLEPLKDPVTIPCGHNYCRGCIEGCWAEVKKKKKYSCPQCRQTFSPRPVLKTNNMLAEVVEKLKKSSNQQISPTDAAACADPADVACDFCSGTKPNKATMSCLTCLASYCSAHLKPHYSVPVLKKHQLVSATIPLQDKMCTKHNKLMEIYCQTDKKCICYLCVIDEHKNHKTVSTAAERAKEQEQLIGNQKKVQGRFQEREKEVNELVQALKDFKSCSKTAVETSDKIFNALISSIKKKQTSAKQLIKAQEKTAVAQAEELQLQLQEEMTELRKSDTELEQLSRVDDHIHFIQTFHSLSTSCESPDLPRGSFFRTQRSFKTATDCMTKLRDDIERLLNDTWPKISDTVSTVGVVLPPEPKTREDFLRYCCPLTLDGNSICSGLSISQQDRRVTSLTCNSYSYGYQYSGNGIKQVLCKQGLSQRCYWEVSWTGGTWSVAVSYKDISTSLMHKSEFGNNNQSWSLECSPYGFSFRHNTKNVTVSGPKSFKIGVFLDYEAGTLSFYSISDTMTLLHKERNTFTQPVYPGLGLRDSGPNSYYAELVKLW